MNAPGQIIFLQLPRIDHDPLGPCENVPLAAAYLRYALSRSAERRHFCARTLPAADRWDDARVVAAIVARRPTVLACTLYLWNIERTLAILDGVRRQWPSLTVIVGGPEVARDHPFLFRSRSVDVAIAGEGEPVFVAVLRGVRTRTRTDFRTVGWRTARGWRWGRCEPPHTDVRDLLPPPSSSWLRPDERGMAYLETTRGCPLRCTYCGYNQQRPDVSCLTPDEVARRVTALRRAGAREIRFIDPTFNANPHFDRIVDRLAAVNRDRRLEFFAELRPDRISREQAKALAAAHFAEIEVGVQCINREVLRRIRRPLDLEAVDRGIHHLSAAGIRVTLDLMYGLPGQRFADIVRALRWAAGRPRVRVQCMQTLLLPGTELRAARSRYGLSASEVPPYAVTATADLSERALCRAEEFIERRLGSSYDCPTQRFVGRRLPDLFASVRSGNRRVMRIRSRDVFAERDAIRRRVALAVRREPHIAWQFVLEVEREEPLDVLDLLIGELSRHGSLVMDRLLGARFGSLRVSRRLFILLRGPHRFDRSWVDEADSWLRRHFF